jgi:hypothetical protein
MNLAASSATEDVHRVHADLAQLRAHYESEVWMWRTGVGPCHVHALSECVPLPLLPRRTVRAGPCEQRLRASTCCELKRAPC